MPRCLYQPECENRMMMDGADEVSPQAERS